MKTSSKHLFTKISNQLSDYHEHGEAQNLAFIILEKLANSSRSDILIDKKIDLTEAQENQLNDWLERLSRQEPIQHIIGHAWFYGYKFSVTKNTLIPRPETEELVDLIVRENDLESPNILDVGTGTGIIPISLKIQIPKVKVEGWDISEKALEIAKKNAIQLNAEVDFSKVDILNPIETDQKWDVIVSNPPYITELEKVEMEKNVLNFDPHLALFVTDSDPLLFYRAITLFAKNHLNPKGKLYFEINEKFGLETKNLVAELSFDSVEVIKDMNGKDRIVKGIKS